MEFRYFTREEVSLMIGDNTRLCLFANYSTTSAIAMNTIQYTNELSRFYDRVLFITNQHNIVNSDMFSPNIRIVSTENQAFDFGLWSRIMKNIDTTHLTELALINDSTHIISRMDTLFSNARNNGYEFWGITDSYQVKYHIQSYFLVFNGIKAIERVQSFFLSKDMSSYIELPVHNIIMDFEVELTSYMSDVVKPVSIYSVDKTINLRTPYSVYRGNILSMPGINQSTHIWDVLIVLGCPILKKKRANTTDSKHYEHILSTYGHKEYVSTI